MTVAPSLVIRISVQPENRFIDVVEGVEEGFVCVGRNVEDAGRLSFRAVGKSGKRSILHGGHRRGGR
ncbi:hypothetical protein ITX31_01825 [Arthrobacter gandavensis]|uniref:hypothetical protein n=1 Tax=Arthrobacter gandavensis TaxID=169960 RepID=UPI00188E3848|nr:hypothetical protein [Arthrobacter gandavensis]MBF4992851.1 hypothetical protein [Arthrobacter gandavensis]